MAAESVDHDYDGLVEWTACPRYFDTEPLWRTPWRGLVLDHEFPRYALPTTPDLSSITSSGRSKSTAYNNSASFVTARSGYNNSASFVTPGSGYNSSASMSASNDSVFPRMRIIGEDNTFIPQIPPSFVRLHQDYHTNLHQKEIIQPFDKELNWSGKGQHVTFSIGEEVPVSVISPLGSSMSAIVDKVLCRRIALARKAMRCNQKWTVGDALGEVYHLLNLRHFHIIQLVGTYLRGRDFSILMYPVAECHLGRFLEETSDIIASRPTEFVARQRFLASTLGCLTSAVAFIHDKTTKHMDIKPQNILVRNSGYTAFSPQ